MNRKRYTNQQALQLLEQMSLEEKLTMIHSAGLFRTGAVERLGVPPLVMSDGPMGVREEMKDDAWEYIGRTDDYVTYLPSNSAIAATWNQELAYRCGQVLGAEARGRGKDVILAPGINIQRSPLCGRNFEYMSEDPLLTAKQCVPLIRGVQENDVAACVKHFALNNQERNRLFMDVQVSERALREIYLPAFCEAVQAGGCRAVMAAYNLALGIRCCESKYLLDEILREEWGFQGIVISDWGGVLRTKESAECGLDIEMPLHNRFDEDYFASPLLAAIQSGEISEAAVDEKVYRILCVMSELHMLEDERKSGCYNISAHREAALDTARESIVLLKNTEGILPLDSGICRLLVIGQNADTLHAPGGGSAIIKALYEVSPLLGLRCQLGGNCSITYTQGYYIPERKIQTENWQATSLEAQQDEAIQEAADPATLERQKYYRDEAVALAANFDHIIFIGGLNHAQDLEDQDRLDMKLPYAQDKLIEALLDVNPNTIIVLNGGNPVEMPWADRAKAIVWSWYAGMEGGTALAEVLLGKVNPSGKLPATFPRQLEDCSAHSIGEFGRTDLVRYLEGIYVGYRHFEKANIQPLFPFGHGLSYTTFRYSNLSVELTETQDGPATSVQVELVNTGNMPGSETIQIYVSTPESSIDRPKKELRGYKKLYLAAGEAKTAAIELGAEAFRYFSEADGRFRIDAGRYQIIAAASSADIRLTQEITLKKNWLLGKY